MQAFDISPFRADGHLHDLGLEAEVAGALSVEVQRLVTLHVGECTECAEALATMRELNQVALPPSPLRALPPPANRPWRTWVAPLSVAAAALIAVTAMPTIDPGTPDDGIRVKGAAGLQLEVWADEGPRSRRVLDGQSTTADDKLGFRVANRHKGHFLIVGVDQDGEVWLGYPQDGGGRAVLTSPHARAAALDEAVRLDGVSGYERIIGLLCDNDIHFDEISTDLEQAARSTDPSERLARLRDDCSQDEVRVTKQP